MSAGVDAKQVRYDRYVSEVSEDIGEVVQQFGCQPILFIGSGLPRRYFGAPSWEELLSHLADKCSNIDKGLGFYKQSLADPLLIGEEFGRLYQEWAWSGGHNEFPESMFGEDVGVHDYIKYKISQHLSSLIDQHLPAFGKSPYAKEIKALQSIKPHAVITTNYDTMLERIFPDLAPIVGQQILKGQLMAVGELFKIHGCVSEPKGIVFTKSDYDAFSKKKKFLSAKLLTFFNEHPLIFIGYSATDPNIRSILSDIDEALPEKGGVIPNVYILEWNPGLGPDSSPPRDKVISTDEDRSIRVKLIESNDFTWVFEAFSANPVLNNVNPKVLRSLIARSYELVRHDIPKMKVEADFKLLTDGVENADTFAKLFGIANVSDFSAASAYHKYSATQLGRKLGGKSWHIGQKLIDRIREEKGVDIKSCDNVYHRAEKVNKTLFHKYSDDAVLLLKKVKAGEAYEIADF